MFKQVDMVGKICAVVGQVIYMLVWTVLMEMGKHMDMLTRVYLDEEQVKQLLKFNMTLSQEYTKFVL